MEVFYLRGVNDKGEGHAFVVDGLFENLPIIAVDLETWVKGKSTSIENSAAPLNLFDTNVDLHINWGWDGSSNGYFGQTKGFIWEFDNNPKLFRVSSPR